MQDVNPLYGRDVYGSGFTRVAGAQGEQRPLHLGDFMLGLRSQYALSNILVANLVQNMHFLYVQDDWRLNDKLTLNLGLRYEYATPWVEEDNVLSNFDPANLRMIQATDGSLADRADDRSGSQQLRPAPRLRLLARSEDGDPRRLRHLLRPLPSRRRRQRAADQRPAGDQRGRQPDQRRSTPPSGRTDQGYPEGLTDPSRFNPAIANITYMPRDYHSSCVQSCYISAQREIAGAHRLDLAYVGNRSDDLLLFANFNQASPNNAAGHAVARQPPADPGLGRHHLQLQRRVLAATTPSR